MGVVVDALEHVEVGAEVGGLVGRLRQAAGDVLEDVEGEGHRRPELQRVGRGGHPRQQRRRAGDERGGEEVAAGRSEGHALLLGAGPGGS